LRRQIQEATTPKSQNVDGPDAVGVVGQAGWQARFAKQFEEVEEINKGQPWVNLNIILLFSNISGICKNKQSFMRETFDKCRHCFII